MTPKRERCVSQERETTNPTRRPISRGKRVAAAAMIRSGVPSRQVAAELGMSRATASRAGLDETIDPDEVAQVAERLQAKLVQASDRYLEQSLSRIKELGPYQAMLCAGIAYDKYVHGQILARSTGGSSVLTQVLLLIDASERKR